MFTVKIDLARTDLPVARFTRFTFAQTSTDRDFITRGDTIHSVELIMPKKNQPIAWLAAPEFHDYPAAASYLQLLLSPTRTRGMIAGLRKARPSTFKAKDIFRASGLSLLGISNSHVEKDLKKIKRGIPLSPLLLVRSNDASRVVIADGYHRLCAVYTLDEDAMIPCRIV
jgi:hypothetical protein